MKPESVNKSQINNPDQDPKNRLLWTIPEILEATNGQCPISHNQSSPGCQRVHADSRTIQEGDLFIPIKGPRVDGHDFIVKALEAGATCALCEESYYQAHHSDYQNCEGVVILVEDVLKALDDLARFARERSVAIIIGVTGSYGKTSQKDALAHVLCSLGPTHKTTRSFNNHWGLPLTLSNLHANHMFSVIEMGMNNPGEIKTYSTLVRPHIALVTNTGDAHIGQLGSLAAIADAKAEIFSGLEDHPSQPIQKTAVLWSNNWATPPYEQQLQKDDVLVYTFGETGMFQAHADLCMQGTNMTISKTSTKEHVTITVPIFSDKWALNCAAVAACVDIIAPQAVDWRDAVQTLETISIPQGRGTIDTISYQGGELTLIDESYNAAPGSMKQSLKTLITLKTMTGRRVLAVLGDMYELGHDSLNYHKALQTIEGFSALDAVYVSGESMSHLYAALPPHQKGFSSLDPQIIAEHIVRDAKPGDIILVKGSRGQWAQKGRMSVVVDAVKALACHLPPKDKKDTLC